MLLPYIDLTNYARANIEKYPKRMQEHAELFFSRAAIAGTGELAGRHVFTSSFSARDLGDAFIRAHANKKEWCAQPGLPTDRSDFDDKDNSWAGMGAATYIKELRGETSKLQANLDKAREELAETGLKEALDEAASSLKRKRRRAFSEYDGDYDHDRRYDVNPFQTMAAAAKEFPYLEFIFPMNMNASASGPVVSQFNARCLALVEVMEGAGYRVAITGEIWGAGLYNLAKADREALAKEGVQPGGEIAYCHRIELRAPDAYGDTASFATLACVEYYRRVLFSQAHSVGHYVQGFGERTVARQVHDGLGSALSTRPIASAPGQVVLTKAMMNALFNARGDAAKRMFLDHMQNTVSFREVKTTA